MESMIQFTSRTQQMILALGKSWVSEGSLAHQNRWCGYVHRTHRAGHAGVKSWVRFEKSREQSQTRSRETGNEVNAVLPANLSTLCTYGGGVKLS